MIDFWDAEIMKIVLLPNRGIDFPFFDIFEKNRKIDAKRDPQIHVFGSKIRPRAACARTGRVELRRDVCLFGCTLPLHFTLLSFWMHLSLHFIRLQFILFFYRIES